MISFPRPQRLSSNKYQRLKKYIFTSQFGVIPSQKPKKKLRDFLICDALFDGGTTILYFFFIFLKILFLVTTNLIMRYSRKSRDNVLFFGAYQ